MLADHPKIGRPTSKGDIRRIMVSPYPYVIFYGQEPAGIVIHGIRHAARRPQ